MYVEACVTITIICVISRRICLSSLSPASRPPKSQFPASRGRVRLVCQPLSVPRQCESGAMESMPSRTASQPEARTCSAARPQQKMTRVGGPVKSPAHQEPGGWLQVLPARADQSPRQPSLRLPQKGTGWGLEQEQLSVALCDDEHMLDTGTPACEAL